MQELGRCCEDARNDPAMGVIILTGIKPLSVLTGIKPLSAWLLEYVGCHGCRCDACMVREVVQPDQHLKALRMAYKWRAAGEGDEAFCSGGDQTVRGQGGYVGADQLPRLNVLDLQVRCKCCTTSAGCCCC